MRMLIAIYAAGEEGEFAMPDGSLPWRHGDALAAERAEDMALFRKATLGSPVIMGYNTYLTLPEGLAGRRNIVIHRGAASVPHPPRESVEFFETLEAALADISPERAFLIGGAALFGYAFARGLPDAAIETVFGKRFPGASLYFKIDKRFVLEEHVARGALEFNFYRNPAFPEARFRSALQNLLPATRS